MNRLGIAGKEVGARDVQSWLRALPLLALLAITACGDGVGTANNRPDPVVVDIPVAYVKRQVPITEETDPETGAVVSVSLDETDLTEPSAFHPGARLYLRDRASPSAPEHVITDRVWGAGAQYDVKDLSVSDDGKILVFAMRGPEIEDADEDEQPTWNIWVYDLTSDTLRRVISQDSVAEEGQDTGPAFLPDGRIVFSSTRQHSARAILLDEGKPQYSALINQGGDPASVLHVMDADGTHIRQLTYNPSHDVDPVVLSDGRIVFSRWDRTGSIQGFNLYSINVDGTGVQLLYGGHSHNTGPNGAESQPIQFVQPTELEDGTLVVLTRQRQSRRWGGDLVTIDVQNYIDNTQPTASNAGAAGPAQSSLASAVVNTDEGISVGGYFGTLAPMWDGSGRLLVSWSGCRLNEGTSLVPVIVPCTDEKVAREGAIEAFPRYGLWVFDPADETLLPVVPGEETVAISDVAILQERQVQYPSTLPTSGVDEDLAAQGTGVVHIRSIYDIAGTDTAIPSIPALADPAVSERSARSAQFLRIVKPMAIPPRQEVNNVNIGGFAGAGGQAMTEILGYVPIEPDGSVKFSVPASVPFGFELVDAQGRRLNTPGPFARRHTSWLQVAPGETLECRGCHATSGDNRFRPHGRLDAEPDSVHQGLTNTGDPFPNTNPELWGDFGQTMAEIVAARHGIRQPSVNVLFTDIWSETPELADADQNFRYRWFDVNGALPNTDAAVLELSVEEVSDENDQELAAEAVLPVSRSCELHWKPSCRVIINYPTHIQPIWDRQRSPEETGLDDTISCTTCHQSGTRQLPVEAAGQLDLSGTSELVRAISGSDDLVSRMVNCVQGNGSAALVKAVSYCDLLFNDYTVFIDELSGLLTGQIDLHGLLGPGYEDVDTLLELQSVLGDQANQALLIALFIELGLADTGVDADTLAQQILAGEVNPAELLTQILANIGDLLTTVPAPMSANGALASSRFFNKFTTFNDSIDTVDHRRLLSEGEKRLLVEWLDLGAQYYNNAFNIPGAQQ